VSIGTTASIVDGLKSTIAQMVSNSRSEFVHGNLCESGPAGPDRSRDEDRVQRGAEHQGHWAGFTVKTLSTQAGELPLIPEWTLSYTGTPGSGSAVLPAYIVTEDLIEYHWLSDPNPRIFQLGVPGSLAPVCGGEVRRRGGKGCKLRALPGSGRR